MLYGMCLGYIDGEEGQLLDGVKAPYIANACVRMYGDLTKSFNMHVGVRQVCVISPWHFDLYMDGVIRELKAKVGKRIAEMEYGGEGWLVTSLFVDVIVLFAKSGEELQKVLNVFYYVCKHRRLKVNE